MNFVSIPTGRRVYVDANVHLYSAFKHPVYGTLCRDLLIRIDEGDVYGYTSDFVLDEVLHKLMIAEVAKKYTLMATDAVHVAIMRRHGLTNIATNDPDFERVGWLTVWKP